MSRLPRQEVERPTSGRPQSESVGRFPAVPCGGKPGVLKVNLGTLPDCLAAIKTGGHF